MKIEQLNNSKVPIIVFDKKLEQFRGKTLFPEKLEKANEILAKAGLPKRRNKTTPNISFGGIGALHKTTYSVKSHFQHRIYYRQNSL